jgi:nucleoside-triphosphatase
MTLTEMLSITDSWLNAILSAAEQEPQIYLVTGPFGTGKTTWCTRMIEKAQTRDLRVCGVLSPGLFQDGEKSGIELINLADGERRLLAVPHTGNAAGIVTAHWHFDPEVLDWGNLILSDLPDDFDVLMVDELGPLEFERGEGLQAGLRAVDARTYKVACVVVRPALLDQAQTRWPGSTVIDTGKA